MSFVTQEDVFNAIEPVLHGIFEEYADWQGKGRQVSPAAVPPYPVPRVDAEIRQRQAGSAQPDPDLGCVGSFQGLRRFGRFASIVESGDVVRAIPAPNTADKSRKFFDDIERLGTERGFRRASVTPPARAGEFGGPIAKNHGEAGMAAIAGALGAGAGRRRVLRRRQGKPSRASGAGAGAHPPWARRWG